MSDEILRTQLWTKKVLEDMSNHMMETEKRITRGVGRALKIMAAEIKQEVKQEIVHAKEKIQKDIMDQLMQHMAHEIKELQFNLKHHLLQEQMDMMMKTQMQLQSLLHAQIAKQVRDIETRILSKASDAIDWNNNDFGFDSGGD